MHHTCTIPFDQVRRRVGKYLFEPAQALIVYAKTKALHARFLLAYPFHNISLATFKRLVPWCARRARQETCMCKQCTNYKGHQDVLASLVKLFDKVAPLPSEIDDCDDDHNSTAG